MLGNQNGMLGQDLRVVMHAEDQFEHPLADIVKVKCALSQQLAAQTLEQG